MILISKTIDINWTKALDVGVLLVNTVNNLEQKFSLTSVILLVLYASTTQNSPKHFANFCQFLYRLNAIKIGQNSKK